MLQVAFDFFNINPGPRFFLNPDQVLWVAKRNHEQV